MEVLGNQLFHVEHARVFPNAERMFHVEQARVFPGGETMFHVEQLLFLFLGFDS